jgi:uncharacterized protein YbaR (Trm112 family)
MNDALKKILVCPECKSPLESKANTFVCQSCQQTYPTLDSIPWLLQNPGASLGEWKEQFKYLLVSLDRDIEEIKIDLRLPDLMASTLKRLRKHLQAKVEQRKLLGELLAPLEMSEAGSYELSVAMKTKLPRSQTLLGYYSNIHRDWSWGDEENKEGFDCIKDLIGDKKDLGKLLVAGAGNCRLLYDVNEFYRPPLVVGVDINPLLFLAARKILMGKTVRLYEFPIAPLDLESYSALRKCRAPEKVSGEVELLFADTLNLPFQKASFDTILTPWLIDIIPESPDTFFPKLNYALSIGGRWLNFGTLVYDYKNPAKDYSKEEVLELAVRAGFEIESQFTRRIPYMQSPISHHGRLESVFCFSAKKVKDLDQHPMSFKTLPEWLTNSSTPIPDLPDFKTLSQVYKIHLEVLDHIDGKTSISQIAKIFEEKYKLPYSEAHDSIMKYLVKTFQEFRAGR